MKTLKDLKTHDKLSPKDYLLVKSWLEDWVKHFTKMADGARETVEKFDLENLDLFYFTDCQDILNKNPESKGVEDNIAIGKRKKAIEYRLLLKKLLGEEVGRKRPCSHCGNDDRHIDTLGDGTGHFLYCPKCGMTTIVTYPNGYDTCIERVLKQLHSKEISVEGHHLYECRTCGKISDTGFSFCSQQCNSCYTTEITKGDKKILNELKKKKKKDCKCCQE